jgi:hypothetical protein
MKGADFTYEYTIVYRRKPDAAFKDDKWLFVGKLWFPIDLC